MTGSLQFRVVLTLLLAGLLLASSSLQAQDATPHFGVWRLAYDVAPRLVNAQEVETALNERYPSELREAEISGSVVLWLFVDDTGAVAEAMVHKSSDYEAFDTAALVIAEAMKFRPALMDENPVGVWMLQKVDFNTR